MGQMIMGTRRTLAARLLLAVALLWVAMWFQAPVRALADASEAAQPAATAPAEADEPDAEQDDVQVPRVTTTVEVVLDDGTTLSETAPVGADEPADEAPSAPAPEDSDQEPPAEDEAVQDDARVDEEAAPADDESVDEAPPADDEPADDESADDEHADHESAEDGSADEPAEGEAPVGEGTAEDDAPVPAPTAAPTADPGEDAQDESSADAAEDVAAAATEDPEPVDLEQHYIVEEATEESSSDDENTVVEEDTHVDADLETDGGDGSSHTDVVTGGTATVTSGVADAVGNIASQSVTQVALGTATDNGKVYIDQIVIIANIGVAKANTGGNSATGNASQVTVQGAGGGEHTVEVDGQGEATIVTDVALAVGNESVTDIDQDMTVVGDGEDASNTQDHFVENIGTAHADSGGNTVTGNIQDATNDHEGGGVGSVAHTTDGDATIASGDAEAIGNLSETTVDQNANATGSGDARVDAVQIANVINFGTASANTGGNTAVGNDSTSHTAQSGGDVDVDANGDAAIDAGDAYATGNISTTDVSQVAEATASGDAEVYVAQSSITFNVGAAAANSGFNTALGNVSVTGVGADGVPNGKTSTDLATMMGVDAGTLSQSFWDDWGVTITNVVNEVTALLEGTGLYPTANLQVTEFIIGDPEGAFVRVRQAVLVLDYAVADATSDGNSATGNATVVEIAVPEGSGAGDGGLTIVTDGEAEVSSGEARSDANDSVTECTQVATGTTPEETVTAEGCEAEELPEGPVWGSGAEDEPGEEPTEPGEDPADPGEDPTEDTGVIGGGEGNPGGDDGEDPGEGPADGDGNGGDTDGGDTNGGGGGGSSSPDDDNDDNDDTPTTVVLASRSGSDSGSSASTTTSSGSLAHTGSPLAVQLLVAALLIGAGAALVRRRSDSRT